MRGGRRWTLWGGGWRWRHRKHCGTRRGGWDRWLDGWRWARPGDRPYSASRTPHYSSYRYSGPNTAYTQGNNRSSLIFCPFALLVIGKIQESVNSNVLNYMIYRSSWRTSWVGRGVVCQGWTQLSSSTRPRLTSWTTSYSGRENSRRAWSKRGSRPRNTRKKCKQQLPSDFCFYPFN